MKTAIKLILIYLGIQLVCGGLIGIPFTIIARMNGGSVDATRVSELTLAPSMLLSMAVMFFYLWKAHYIPKDKTSWSFISFPFLIITFLIGLSMTVLMDMLTAVLSWVPDILEQQFDALQSGWLGIVHALLCCTRFLRNFCSAVVPLRHCLNAILPGKPSSFRHCFSEYFI